MLVRHWRIFAEANHVDGRLGTYLAPFPLPCISKRLSLTKAFRRLLAPDLERPNNSMASRMLMDSWLANQSSNPKGQLERFVPSSTFSSTFVPSSTFAFTGRYKVRRTNMPDSSMAGTGRPASSQRRRINCTPRPHCSIAPDSWKMRRMPF